MPRLHFSLFAALGGALFCAVGPTSASTAYADALSAGLQAIRTARPEAAAAALDRAVRANPNHSGGWSAWGLLALASGQTSTAKDAFRRALEIDAGCQQAAYGLALADAMGARPQDGIHALAHPALGGYGPAAATLAYLESVDNRNAPADGKDALSEGVRAKRTGEGWASVVARSEASGRAPLVATFQQARPVQPGWSPRAGLKPPAIQPTRTVSGATLWKAPDTPGADHAVFRVNGERISVTNVLPLQWSWDTTAVPNGVYIVSATALTPKEAASTRVEVVKVANAGAKAAEPPEGVGPAMAALTDLLTPRPDPRYARLRLATEAESQGDAAGARRWLEDILADDPGYGDALASLRRLSGGKPAPMVYRGPEDRKLIALTFDDGPVPYRAPALLDILDGIGVKATFFVVGKQAAAHPDLVRRVKTAGHDVQCHSWSHRNLARLSLAECVQELASSRRLIRRLTGVEPRYLRPPGGNVGPVTREAAGLMGMDVAMWTFNAGVTEGMPVEDMVPRYVAAARPGAIFLVHDGTDKIGRALPAVVAELRRQGYEFVTLSELLR